MFVKRRIFCFSALLMIVLALVTEAFAAPVQISGEVHYPERIDIPPGAHLVVRLLDVSRQDQRPTVSAEAAIPSPPRLPLLFTLRFDGNLVIPAHRYGLDAAITADGTTWFRSARIVRLNPLDPPASVDVELHFVGVITNLPDARLPGTNAEPGIVGVHWRVVAINGTPVPADPEMSLMITRDLRAGGRGGCNSYMAQAVLDGPKLAFSPVATTHLVCPAPVMADEAAFFDTLGRVVTYFESGATLTLFDSQGKAVVTFTRSAG